MEAWPYKCKNAIILEKVIAKKKNLFTQIHKGAAVKLWMSKNAKSLEGCF